VKTLKTVILGAALLAFAGGAQAAEIVRHTGPQPAMILQGVTIPPGAEVAMMSGALASPIDPSKTPDSIESFGDTKTQTISTLNNIKARLAAIGFKMSDIVKLTVFVNGDPKLGGKMDFAGMNEGFKMFFGSAENPNTVARSTVQVAALAGPYFLVEIEATAARMPTAAKK
jgi:enamine deaminase RidA (YjgF/YER057c/UK114 family)